MNVKLAYLGHSSLTGDSSRQTLCLAPNLAREPVAFDGVLLQPLRFREAISALHDVVVSDLRYKPRDKNKTAYLAWKKEEDARLSKLRSAVHAMATEEIAARRAIPLPKDFERTFESARKKYWDCRVQYSNYLYRHDQDLWRKLMPCDPVITVADDVLFFECFSADESSYGCLTADRRDAFGRSDQLQLGTTNVDYSWDLYHHFQGLRSYRETRFRVDPAGFEVATGSDPGYHEEKIDLPDGWLKGFMQLQSAMTLPATKVTLSRAAVYSVLAWLRRHRAWKSPRAMRFELTPGEPIQIVLEPWEVPIVDHGSRYDGPPTLPIRVWGTKRVLSLARVLPLAESFDVHLLGTGLPHFWVARMGEMRLTLGLSGWTTNDWTRAAALDLIAPPANPSKATILRVVTFLQTQRSAKFRDIAVACLEDDATTGAALRHLAYSGQLIYDLTAEVYRWRQILPQALGEAEIGPPHPELVELRKILARGPVKLESREVVEGVGTLATATIGGTTVEALIDPDGRIKRGKCLCGHFRKYGLKNGPCAHMMALRWAVTTPLRT